MTMALRRTVVARELLTSLRFVATGLATLAIYVGSYTVFQSLLPSPAALALAYALAITFHYLSSRSFTFRTSSYSRPNRSELLRYAALVGVGYLINLGCLYVFRLWSVTDQLILVIGTIANTSITFLLARFWVFRSP